MVGWILRPSRALVKVLCDTDSPRQIALGVAIGMLIGIVPKGNLLAIMLGTVLFVSRANLASGAASAFLFTWVGFLLDPLSHRVGLGLLKCGPLQGIWTWLFDLPLVPWTALNNTVVMGSLVLGLALFYPLLRFSEPLIAKAAPRLRERLLRYHIGKVLLGMDVVSRGGLA